MEDLLHPLTIGNVTLENHLILGPMAGVCDLPFRLLCHEMGAGLVTTEMVSAKAIEYKNKNTEKLMKTDPRERPVALQLFGSDPDCIGRVAKSITDRDFDILDFNMGCPVPKVVSNGDGSALMKDPALAGRIIEALVRSSKKPVTVKIRKGFDEASVNAVEIARVAESAGAAAITVHGRTREQYYAGQADWEIIGKVKAAVKIPVIGNGDLKSASDVLRMYRETGCDGFMIARGAEGNPWIFREIIEEIKTGSRPPRPTPEEIRSTLLRQAEMMIEEKGEYTAMREMRKHAAWYTAGMKNAARLRERLSTVSTLSELSELSLLLLQASVSISK